jgi:hypothetical protein
LYADLEEWWLLFGCQDVRMKMTRSRNGKGSSGWVFLGKTRKGKPQATGKLLERTLGIWDRIGIGIWAG